MKAPAPEGFGDRLARIRKSRAMTQKQLGSKVGLSQRMIAYYERESPYPPGHVLPLLAQALHVTADELLGLKPLKVKADPRQARLMNRLKRIEELPPADQRTALKVLDAMLAARGKGNGR